MNRLLPTVAAMIVIGVAAYFPVVTIEAPGIEPLPAIPEDPKARKQTFFGYLQPVVEHANTLIQKDREWLLERGSNANLNWFAERRWQALRVRYRVSDELDRASANAELAKRVMPLPPALVLAQAAKESGWGRSRFAREGNALFGERCFNEGCGIVPKGRGPNGKFEVESFPTVAASVESYLLNLNSHERYEALREERFRLTGIDQPVTGIALAAFTGSYSERGDAYVQEIIGLISHNGLDDTQFAQEY